MEQNIIFVGGIHGSGKGVICKELCQSFNFEHLSASKVLKWEEISSKENKNVSDIESTQERLLKGLSKVIEPNKSYFLDGHFCLLNSYGEPQKVPEKTFIKINPFAIIVITCDEQTISSRLKKRDDVEYSVQALKDMQDLEFKFANKISHKLNIPFFNVEASDDRLLQKFLRDYESTH